MLPLTLCHLPARFLRFRGSPCLLNSLYADPWIRWAGCRRHGRHKCNAKPGRAEPAPRAHTSRNQVSDPAHREQGPPIACACTRADHELAFPLFQEGKVSLESYLKFVMGGNWIITPSAEELEQQRQQFGDLMITAHTDGLCRIPETAQRAISLDQLRCVVTHAETRLLVKREKWAVSRLGEAGKWCKYMLEDPKEITLYDLADYVIRPATELFKCSLVEIMADKPQPPDYFVSQ